MNVRQFSYIHPLAYRRLLLAACASMVIVGLGSSFGLIHPSSLHLADTLSLPLDMAQSKSPAHLVSLPGNDGSAPTSELTQAAAVVRVSGATANGDARALGQAMNAVMFGDGQWPALERLWTRESNWNPNARNRYSGACGIPQALPCRIPDMTAAGQIQWGLDYIKRRYGTPGSAWNHELAFGWY